MLFFSYNSLMKPDTEKSNLILIGMPGCGKSTCGVLAAKALCKRFVDTDLLIQDKEGLSLQEILNFKGTDYFSEAESRILQELTVTNSMISTGGSAVYYEDAMKHLKENGTVIYLKISLDEMLSRIRNITTRGILLHPGETVREMYDARVPLYEKYADIVIDCDHLTVEQAVAALCEPFSPQRMEQEKQF